MKTAFIVVCIIAVLLAAAAYHFYTKNKQLQIERDSEVAEISKTKKEEISRIKNAYDELVVNMQKEIEKGQVKITQLSDRLSVSMIDKILFPSGEADITPEGLEVLERVGSVLENTPNQIIRVEGHTDNVPIRPRLQKQFSTNWELSTARATNVVRFLQDTTGIDPRRLQAIGMSEYHPVASNDTDEGRSQNRRIEIILLPEPTNITE